jgi:beta-glucanase (GH16 family)
MNLATTEQRSRWRLAALLCALVLAAMTASAQTNTAWTLVWSDEFTQPDGSAPDPAKWTYDIGAGGWGNNEPESYTSRTNNVRIENGQLVIEARRESYHDCDYTSARLKTQGKASWTFGRIEARMKIPRGQGVWPAFWMLGTNIPSVAWPNCGEIDIMENIGKEPTLVHGTVHGPGYAGPGGIHEQFSLPGGGAYADDFHVFAVEWSTNQIKWFVDGQQYFSVTPASLPPGTKWVFTQPQFILLNLAVGGNWPGYPDGTTTFPQRLIVDYVRVYAPANVSANRTNTPANDRLPEATRRGVD